MLYDILNGLVYFLVGLFIIFFILKNIKVFTDGKIGKIYTFWILPFGLLDEDSTIYGITLSDFKIFAFITIPDDDYHSSLKSCDKLISLF